MSITKNNAVGTKSLPHCFFYGYEYLFVKGLNKNKEVAEANLLIAV